MSTEPLALDTIICGRCATACDANDNFCRQCGMSLQDEELPAVRPSAGIPAVWQPQLRSIAIKSAAFIAAGTIAEVLLRRMARQALAPLTRGSKRRAARHRAAMVPADGDSVDDPQIMSDTLLLRHIRIRR